MSEADWLFTPWRPLGRAELGDAPKGRAAVQLRRAEGLLSYPRGKSTMVVFLVSEDVVASMERLLGAELDAPGALGHGPLWVRWCVSDDAEQLIGLRYSKFVARFGAEPALQRLLGGDEAQD
jgi:hypothetical protein